MNKKILFGSICVALLLASMPYTSVAQENEAVGTFDTDTAEPEALLNTLIIKLQYIHDYLVENYPEINEQVDLDEFQKNINILSQGWMFDLFCEVLFLVAMTLSLISLFFMLVFFPIFFIVYPAYAIVAILYDIICQGNIPWSATENCACAQMDYKIINEVNIK